MSTEENVPKSRSVNVAAYRQAVRTHNNKIRREEILRTIPKILGIAGLWIAAIIATYLIAQWLLASRPIETHAPIELLTVMAVAGAILIVAGVAFVIKLIVGIIQGLNESVGFSSYFVSIGGVVMGVATVGIAIAITLYLAVFYNV